MLTLQLLQTPSLTLPNGSTFPLERKDAALLALLVMDGARQPGHVAALLWPDSLAATARASLRQRLFRLRKRAGRAVADLTPRQIRLADNVDVDVLRFETDLAKDPQAGRGELLGNHDYTGTGDLEAWVTAVRKRWRDRCFDLLAKRASALEARNHIADALVLAQRMVADDPLHEHNHRRLMRLHYLRGDRAAALAAYHACSDHLRNELGARPDDETEQLAATIESSGALPHPTPPPRPAVILRPPRQVGRAAVWLDLVQAWEAGPPLVVILGEPGIGKSRLLDDFCRERQVSFRTAALVGDSGVPYALLSRLLNRLVAQAGFPGEDWARDELARFAPALGTAPLHPFQKVQVVLATQHALERWHGNGITGIAIDDLHFADAATLDLLPALAAAPMRWLMALRGPNVALDAATAAPWPLSLEPNAHRRIELRPLTEADLEQLITDLSVALDPLQWAPRLLQHTGGNPLFVLETLLLVANSEAGLSHADALHLPLPHNVTTLIGQRLAQLDPQARRLAYLAAVAGQDFEPELAARLLNVHLLDLAQPLRTLERWGVLRGAEFAHDLVRKTLREEVPEIVARTLHKQLAVELERAGVSPARIAEHWEAACESAPAAAAWQRAAALASAAQRPTDAMAMLERAERNFEAADDHVGHFTAMLARCEAGRAAAEVEAAKAIAAALLRMARTSSALALAHEQIGRCQDAEAAFDAARVSYRAGMSAAQQDADQDMFHRLAFQGALMSVHRDGPMAAVAALESLLPWVYSLASLLERLDRLVEFGIALQAADRRERARSIFLECLDHAEKLGDRSRIAETAMQLGATDLRRGNINSAGRWCEQAWRTRLQLSGRSDSACLKEVIFLAPIWCALGQYRQALQLLEPLAEQMAIGDSMPAMAGVVNAQLANVWLHMAQPAKARQALGTRPDHDHLFPLLRWLRVDAQLSNDAQTAIDRYREIEHLTQVAQIPEQFLMARFDQVLIEPVAATPEQVRTWRQDCMQRELISLALHGRLALVHSLMARSAFEESAAEARLLLAELQGCGTHALYRPQFFLTAHDALHRVGDGDAALQAAALGARWVRTAAAEGVDAPFVEAFLHRSAVNRRLLALAPAGKAERPPA